MKLQHVTAQEEQGSRPVGKGSKVYSTINRYNEENKLRREREEEQWRKRRKLLICGS
jgi:hypothetical protein